MVETRPVNVVVVMGTDGTVSVDGTDGVGDDTQMNSHARQCGILVHNGSHIVAVT